MWDNIIESGTFKEDTSEPNYKCSFLNEKLKEKQEEIYNLKYQLDDMQSSNESLKELSDVYLREIVFLREIIKAVI